MQKKNLHLLAKKNKTTPRFSPQEWQATCRQSHKVITNYQNSITKDIKPGEIIKIKWPIPTGSIYPAIH